MLQCMPLHAHFFIFSNFQSETAITKCKKECLYGKKHVKNPGDFYWRPRFVRLSPTTSLRSAWQAKVLGKKLRKKSDLVFLVKKTKNCQFFAKNHWKSAKITQNTTSCKPTTPLRSQRDLWRASSSPADSLRASRFQIVSLFWFWFCYWLFFTLVPKKINNNALFLIGNTV